MQVEQADIKEAEPHFSTSYFPDSTVTNLPKFLWCPHHCLSKGLYPGLREVGIQRISLNRSSQLTCMKENENTILFPLPVAA